MRKAARQGARQSEDSLGWITGVRTVGSPSLANSRTIEIQCDSTGKEATVTTTTTMVHVRVDERIKAQATETLAAMGLSVSAAVRAFFMGGGADKQMAFALEVPNAKTRAAMAEADEMARTHRVRFDTAAELLDDLEKNSRK